MNARKRHVAGWLACSLLASLGTVGCWSSPTGMGYRQLPPSNTPPPPIADYPANGSPTRTTPTPKQGLGTSPAVSSSSLPSSMNNLTPQQRSSVSGGHADRAALNQGAIANSEMGEKSTGAVLPPPDPVPGASSKPIATNAGQNRSTSGPDAVTPVNYTPGGNRSPEAAASSGNRTDLQTELPPVAPISYQDINIKRNWQKSSPPAMPEEPDLPLPTANPKFPNGEKAAPLLPPPQ